MDGERVAIVTGAARGIGAATAVRLAQDGFSVAVCDLSADACGATVEAVRSTGRQALAVAVDVADSSRVDAAVAEVADTLGPPVVLVNNAGFVRDNLLFRMTDDDFDAVIGVHLRGAFLMTRAVQRHMVEAKWGRVVNVSSTSALGNRGQANYSAAKAGVQGLTKTTAIELGPFGITANAVAPGYIATDMTAGVASALGISVEENEARVAAGIPVRRVGRPDDIAQTVSFFVSEASGFVNGQVLYVAGGPRT